MNRAGLSVAVALAVCFWPAHPHGQGLAPPPPPGTDMRLPQARGTGLILGQVVDGQGETPVPGATVSLSGNVTFPAPGRGAGGAPTATYVEPRRVFADAQGRFTFTDLPAGSFLLSAIAPGYQPGLLNQGQAGGPAFPMVLAPDQKMGGIKISMWRYASISGTVVEDGGAPAVNATVRVLRRQAAGRASRFLPGQSARTDDRGVYRIASLVPGDYVVSVPSTTTTMPASVVDLSMQLSRQGDGGIASRAFSDRLQDSGAPATSGLGIRVGDVFLQTGPMDASSLGPIARDDGTILVQPSLFFASARTIGSATTITLNSGDDRSAIDFQLNPVRGYSVSGILTGTEGATANLGVRLLPADVTDAASNIGLETATTISDASGQFMFMGVPPGAYQLRVVRVPRSTSPGGSPNPMLSTEPTLFAQLPVSVGSADVAGLSVALRTGPTLSGRVEFDGQAPRPPLGQNVNGRPLMVNLIPVVSGPGAGQAVVNEDSQFSTTSMPPGRYLLVASAPGWTLKSAMVNGRDISLIPLDLDDDVSGLVVTFFDRPAQLSGTVRNSRGEPDTTAVVILVDANYQACMEAAIASRCLRTSPVSPAGTFTFPGLVPGDYLVAAVERSLLGSATPAANVLDALAPQAQRLTLAEGQRQTQELTTRTVVPR
jgi:hypothetical protein